MGLGPPSGDRSAAPSLAGGVRSLCRPRASRRQYSTIARRAQQEAGVGRDPRPTTQSLPDVAGRMRSNSPIVSLKRVAPQQGGCDRACCGPISAVDLLQLGRSANGMSALEELRRSTEWRLWPVGPLQVANAPNAVIRRRRAKPPSFGTRRKLWITGSNNQGCHPRWLGGAIARTSASRFR
jgi:hypothetical protein